MLPIQLTWRVGGSAMGNGGAKKSFLSLWPKMKGSLPFSPDSQSPLLTCSNSVGLFSFILNSPKLNLKFLSFKYILAAE